MNHFIVSARKYRPDTFDTVVGQKNIISTLKNAIRSNHLAQAFLFTGPRGVGKTTTARLLAKTVNCTAITDHTEACNQCDSCKSFNAGTSLNIFELDAASNNSVDDIRVLVEQIRYPPQGGRYKVYIIDEVHMLSTNAFNAFLKTLEEPPPYAIFILATTEKHKIIPTILSRCQIFDFSRITTEDIAQQLAMIAKQEKVKSEEDALHVIAQKADGSMRDALSMFDQQVSFAGNTLTYKSVIENLNVLDFDYYFRITNEILSGNTSAALLTFDEILSHGFDGHNFITGLSSHFRDLLICQDEVTLKLLEVSPNVREKYKIQSRQGSAAFFLALLELSNKCDMSYRAARHQRLQVELALMKMCELAVDPAKKKSSSGNALNIPLPASTPVVQTPPVLKTAEIKPSAQPPQVSEPIPARSKGAAPSKTAPEGTQPGIKPRSPSHKTISITEGLMAQETGKRKSDAPIHSGSDQVTPEKLYAAWSEYAENQMKAGRLTLHTALTKRMPELKDDFTIHFILDNGAVEKDLNEIRVEFLTHLRASLNNGKITLTTEIDREPEKNKAPYTPREKFDYLAAKNPALLELKKQLDLDTDF